VPTAKEEDMGTAMRPRVMAAALLVAATVGAATQVLLCEWRGEGGTVQDPCPEFYWPAGEQAAYRVLVATKPDLLSPGKADLWDSEERETDLNIAEYAGRALPEGTDWWWLVEVRRPDGEVRRSEPARMRYERRVLPRRLPHIRTFLNFGSRPELIASRYDLTYVAKAKEFNPQIITVNYSLIATCVVPSSKADLLAEWCVARGLTTEGVLEDLFLHYSMDTKVTLHVGAERADRPVETRVVPGWDPRNDRNGDGVVDDEEAAGLVNPGATARRPSEARVPIYYWPPPRADYVMMVGHPEYQAFMAEVYLPRQVEGYDALYTDTTPARVPSRWGSEILEYPGPTSDGAWRRDMQRLMAAVKARMPDTPWLANGWLATPFVIDGMLRENWLSLGQQLGQAEQRINEARELDARGKVQLLQYNPVYDPEESEFGVRVDVDRERDRIYGLGCYYLACGESTYFAVGQHPYGRAEDKWFGGIEANIGTPKSAPRVLYEGEVESGLAVNLLQNGGFEYYREGEDRGPVGWATQEPVEFVTDVVHGGRRAARISSTSASINNINRLPVTLKPNTTYTLSAWVRTEGIEGEPGAQVYPYEFDGAQGLGMITVVGTTPWRRYALAFTTAQDTEGRINFRVYGAVGTAWFDDLALHEGTYLPWRVLARDFTSGLVLVRPPVAGYGDETARDFALDTAWRPLHMDGGLGEATRSVRLRSGEAVVLARAD